MHAISRTTRMFGALALALTFTLGMLGTTSYVAHAEEMDCQGAIGAVSTGALIVPDGATCELTGTNVNGNITVLSGGELIANGVFVDGNVQGQDARNVALNGGSSITGNVQLQSGSSVTISGIEISGDLQLEENNGMVVVSDNVIFGNAQLKDNDGGTSVSGNDIGNQLQCQDNDPDPAGGGNTAEQKQGECERL